MADGDLHEQIAQIEFDIEQLAQTLEKCRKAILFSKVAIGAGAIWILAYLVGAIRFDPTMMIAAIAAVIGGVVFYGSNSSTSKVSCGCDEGRRKTKSRANRPAQSSYSGWRVHPTHFLNNLNGLRLPPVTLWRAFRPRRPSFADNLR